MPHETFSLNLGLATRIAKSRSLFVPAALRCGLLDVTASGGRGIEPLTGRTDRFQLFEPRNLRTCTLWSPKELPGTAPVPGARPDDSAPPNARMPRARRPAWKEVGGMRVQAMPFKINHGDYSWVEHPAKRLPHYPVSRECSRPGIASQAFGNTSCRTFTHQPPLNL